MRLSHLREALARLPAHLSGWTETNVESLTWDVADGVIAEFDREEEEILRAELKEANDVRDTALKESEEAAKKTEEAEEKAEKIEEECAKLREEMAALKDPSDEGQSVATYRQRAIDAEAQEEKWQMHVQQAKRHVEEMHKELTNMRKRKGVEPGLMAHSWDVSSFLARAAHYGNPDAPRYNATSDQMLASFGRDAKELLQKIRNTAEAGTKTSAGKAA